MRYFSYYCNITESHLLKNECWVIAPISYLNLNIILIRTAWESRKETMAVAENGAQEKCHVWFHLRQPASNASRNAFELDNSSTMQKYPSEKLHPYQALAWTEIVMKAGTNQSSLWVGSWREWKQFWRPTVEVTESFVKLTYATLHSLFYRNQILQKYPICFTCWVQLCWGYFTTEPL